MTESANPDHRQLEWLDYARYGAAMAVVAYHYFANGPRAGKTGEHLDFGLVGQVAEYGYLGVDLFFIISGYMVLYSAMGRGPDRFAVSRFIRLWPTFAVCMTLTALIKTFAPPAGDSVGLLRYAVNLTMIPDWLGAKPVDGVYWTLAYELSFYGAIFVVMLLGQLHRLAAILVGWTLLLAASRIGAAVFDLPIPPLFGTYFELFAAGSLLAVVRDRGWRPWSIACMAALIAMSILGAAERASTVAADRVLEPWVAGLIVGLLFLPFLLIRGSGPRLPLARHLGRITYPLYLLHAQIGYALLTVLDIPSGWAVAITVAAVTALAALVYLGFEETTHGLRVRLADATFGAAVRRVQRRLGRKAGA